MGVFKKGIFYSILKNIERFNYKNSDLIVTQSEESKSYISDIFPKKNIYVFYNVPRSNFYKKHFTEKSELKLIYAGLLGHAQNILKTCQMIDFDSLNIIFTIYGEGSQSSESFSKILHSLGIFGLSFGIAYVAVSFVIRIFF